MNIHTYEKIWFGAAMVLIVGLIVTITYGAVGIGIAMVDDSHETIDPNALDEHPDFSDPGVEQIGENEYEVYVIAQQFSYQPFTIDVPANSTVTFHVTSADVIHSFSIAGTNVNAMVIPGEIASMTVEFDEPDQYGVVCNEYCGEAHHVMEAQLIVHPEDEFDDGNEDTNDASIATDTGATDANTPDGVDAKSTAEVTTE